jgi:trehalose 6-phosphate synthase/phosphatase
MCDIFVDDNGKFREFDMQGDTKMDERKLSVDGSQSSPKPQNMSRHLSHGSQSRFTMEKMEELKETEKELQLSNKDTVIAVFRMLPFRVERDEGGGWRVVEEKKQKKSPVSPVSLLGQTQAEGQQPYNIKFVGQPGVFVEDPNERKEIQKLLAPHNCIPVFVNESAAQKHIQTCHEYLWPVFHNMKVFLGPTNNSEIEKDGWKTFKDVNKAYADAIAANMDPQTLVWIHDYHLIMVARFLFLNRDMQCAGLGFFLHSAFPSSEVLRCIPMRIELLQSLLSCHCVTFQIFEYARHFLTCCKVLLNCNYSFQEGGVLQVEHESRSIVVRTDHVVLPYNKLLQRIDDSPKIIDRAKSIRDQYPDRTIFGAIDGDEPFAGLTLKMRAFHSFVSDCPDHRSKVAFVQHIVVTKHNDQGSADLIRIVRQMADEINAKYCRAGDPPLVTIKTEDSDTDEQLAILLATDVLLDTSINDGLNLYPFMFYCAHAKSQKGVVIVSEFTGCSNVLTGAMKINPWNTKAVVDAMNEAIMVIAPESNAFYESEAETNKRKRESSVRFIQDHSYVSTQTFDKWVHQNMVDLKACRHSKSNTINMDLGFEKRFLNSGARALSMDNVVRDYRQCKGTRLIFVDNEGTISPDRRHVLRYGVNAGLNSAPMTCDPDTIEALRMLASDQRNIVVVISGREREVLDECFGDIASLGLCAEHGFYWTMPGRLQPCKVLDSAIGRDGREPSPESKQHERWRSKNSLSEQDNDWKTVCVELFKMYTKRVQGSIIEQKGSAVSWIYHQVGAQDLAQPVALELARLVDPSEPQGLMRAIQSKLWPGLAT